MRIEGLGSLNHPERKPRKQASAQQAPRRSDDLVELSRRADQQDSRIYSPNPGRTSAMQSEDQAGQAKKRPAPDEKSHENSRVDGANSSSSEKAHKARQERIAEARKKVSEGYYNNPAHYGDLADKILKRLGL